ncbi:MAG: FAD-dependent oxidoreductase [Cyanobacteriota bacterium]|jgi:hypothetical protein
MNLAQIEAVDGVIVGGGVAGVAIAEYLARHSSLRLRVLEQAPQLALGSSGKLEGWFHTGGLYSGQDDGQTFMNCVNSLEDLLNDYAPYFGARCNFRLQEAAPEVWQPRVFASADGWFNPNPVYLIHPQSHCPELSRSGLQGDRVQMELQRQRVFRRLEAAYGGRHNWRQGEDCLAPTYAQVEQEGGLPAASLLTENSVLTDYCRRFDQSFQQPFSDYAFLRCRDAAMDTYAILRDLTASALSQGVEFETGITLEEINGDRYGPVRLKSLVYRDAQGKRKHLKAKAFIFAAGENLGPILTELNLRARLKRNLSAMIVAYPALSGVNFVRMSTKNAFHFNHFVQSVQRRGQLLTYSLLANSGYAGAESRENADIEPLLDAAERYFGADTLYGRRLWSYDCLKTELVSDDEQKRRYSYWIESAPSSNYLCVLPGKFSFFPTVARQTFQRLKSLIPVPVLAPLESVNLSPTVLAEAENLVALPYPQQLLQNDLDSSAVE